MAECTYRLRITEERVWECLACGVYWKFEEGGPKESQMYYCPRCGAKIVRLEWTKWNYGKDKLEVNKGETYGKD